MLMQGKHESDVEIAGSSRLLPSASSDVVK
jgi:hypothetical protein